MMRFDAGEWFGPSGRMAEALAGYEHRTQQAEMADAVWDTLTSRGRLAVEAGTGTGKTLAYLVPAVLWSRAEEQRVVVSTYTRLLQSQLLEQDLRVAGRALGPTPSAVAYGQENYLCRSRLELHVARGLFDSKDEARAADELLDWSAQTTDGLLLSYQRALPAGLGRRIGRDSAACQGRNCRYHRNCFYQRARQSWSRSAILVVNHALFLSSVVGEADLLPPHSVVIFDEAHRLEEVCARHFGLEVSQHALSLLLGTAAADRAGLVRLLPPRSAVRRTVGGEAAQAHQAVEEFFAQVASGPGGTAARVHLLRPLPTDVPAQALERLAATVDEVAPELDDALAGAELAAAGRGLHRAAAALSAFERPDADRNVYWLEHPAPGRLTLLSAPLDVAPALQREVYDRLSSTVLTSATLTVAGRFDFFCSRLGLDDFSQLRLDSPFDYPRCGLLYLPARLPLPTAEEKFHEAAANEISRLIELSRGRALVLFTSFGALNAVFGLMPEGPYRLLRQGDRATARLLDEFREDQHSVLFATQSFWQGVDVPGEALSCLVICRLPFDVPDEPRLTAIAEQMREQGLDPFECYQLPTAVLRFRQGFGRLIRTSRDRGVVCVLDRRIVGRQYGPLFLCSLPAGLPMTERPEDVRAFFSE